MPFLYTKKQFHKGLDPSLGFSFVEMGLRVLEPCLRKLYTLLFCHFFVYVDCCLYLLVIIYQLLLNDDFVHISRGNIWKHQHLVNIQQSCHIATHLCRTSCEFKCVYVFVISYHRGTNFWRKTVFCVCPIGRKSCLFGQWFWLRFVQGCLGTKKKWFGVE